MDSKKEQCLELKKETSLDNHSDCRSDYRMDF